MKQINHSRMFFSALRTATIFISGFLIYEILVKLEKLWNTKYPEYRLEHFFKRKIIKFSIILLIDLMILYLLFFSTGIHL